MGWLTLNGAAVESLTEPDVLGEEGMTGAGGVNSGEAEPAKAKKALAAVTMAVKAIRNGNPNMSRRLFRAVCWLKQ